MAGLAAAPGVMTGSPLGQAVDASPPRSAREYNSRAWQTDEGLPHNLVRAIAQTREGYLWVGTRLGLARFDGLRFTCFDAGNTPAIKESNITALCVDREGGLWIGTYGGGLVRLQDGAFSHYGATNGLAGDEVSVIQVGKDGALWVGTTTGLSRYQNGRFTNFGLKEGLASEIVRSVCEDHAGNIWIATGLGLNRLRGGVLDCFNSTNGLPHNSIRGLLEDAQGRLWIGSDAGLTCYDRGQFVTFGAGEGLSDRIVQVLCEDGQGGLWVGTYSGLSHFRSGQFVDELNNDGAPYDLVNALFEDREGDLWIGSREGLIRLIPKRFSAFTRRQGLAHDNVMCVQEDRSGNLWAGTWEGGLNELSGGKVRVFDTKHGFPSDLILSTCESHDGSLWVGADFDGGLTRLKDGALTHYSWKDGLINAAVRVLHEDRFGNLWIGTSRGLNCLRDGKFSRYMVTNHLAGDDVRAICEDHLGNLWIGTTDGLSRLQNGEFANCTVKDGLSSSLVMSLYEDARRDLWIGTSRGGLNRLHNGHFVSYTTKEGLFSDDVLEIVEDDSGYFWMSCLRGVSRVCKAEFDALDQKKIQSVHCVSYGRMDGLVGVVCNGVSKPAGWKARDGRIWFPTTKGLIAIDSNIKPNETPPPVIIEQLVIDKHPVNLVAPSPGEITGDAAWGAPRAAGAPVRIPQGRGELEFHYTALSLQMPEKNGFRYQLEGVDPDWVDAGARRTAYYNNTPPGKYRFRVIAGNNDGVWNETPATVAIELLPHFWQTVWFRLAAGLAIVGAITGCVRYVSVKKLHRKLAILESQHALEKERARIAKDIHDDLGSRLTQITLLSDQTQDEPASELRTNVRKISATAREMAQSLDEIVWAINPEHDTLEGLAEYLSQVTDDFLQDTPIRSRLKVPACLPACTIPADVRHQLFLAFKEALNNAVKHGAASEIQIELAAEPTRLQIKITDNGVGFETSSPPAGGNGLRNMRQRLESIGGQFNLASWPGEGTRIVFTIDLNYNSASAAPLS